MARIKKGEKTVVLAPAVGRVVRYSFVFNEKLYDVAAMVTGVYETSMVDLCVFLPRDYPNSDTHPTHGVFAIPYSEKPVHHTWRWPERV